MAERAEESPRIPEVDAATDGLPKGDAATDGLPKGETASGGLPKGDTAPGGPPGGLHGPIRGFIYDNKPYTGAYVYPEFLNANGVIIWKGFQGSGTGVAIGQQKPLSVVDRYPNFPDGGTIQFGFTQGNGNGQVNDQQHKFLFYASSHYLASFSYTGNGYLVMSMEYNGIEYKPN